MKLDLKKIKYYFLTCNNPERKNHIINEFKEYDTHIYENKPINNKYKSGPIGISNY